MGKHERLIKKYKIDNHPEWNVLEVTLNYQLGGWNYFTGVQKPRGLELHCTPLERHGNGSVYTGFSGIYKLVKEMNRFSAKKLREFEVSQEDFDAVKNHIINKHNIKIEEYV
jgi:hypothetical protein